MRILIAVAAVAIIGCGAVEDAAEQVTPAPTCAEAIQHIRAACPEQSAFAISFLEGSCKSAADRCDDGGAEYRRCLGSATQCPKACGVCGEQN